MKTDMPKTLKTIGSNLRELRRLHGLTQVEFGEQVGVSSATVSTWESGSFDMGVKRLGEVSWYFGVTPDLMYRPGGFREIDPQTLKLRRYLAAEDGGGWNGSQDES